jgi:hypothetical protein
MSGALVDGELGGSWLDDGGPDEPDEPDDGELDD